MDEDSNSYKIRSALLRMMSHNAAGSDYVKPIILDISGINSDELVTVLNVAEPQALVWFTHDKEIRTWVPLDEAVEYICTQMMDYIDDDDDEKYELDICISVYQQAGTFEEWDGPQQEAARRRVA